MPKLAICAAGVVFTVGLLAAPVARAQERDPAAAQALFDEAKALMNAKRYAEACVKLAESLRLDPGIGTQFNLAACHEHEGKLASAWAGFLEVASLAKASGQTARAQAASRRASLLEGRLPRLKILVPAAVRVPGLEITRDGVVVGEAQWELALPLDPGEHRVEVTAPGRRAFAGAVSVVEGATATFEVSPLEAAAEVEAAPVAPLPPVAEAPVAPAPQPVPIAEAPVSESSSEPSGLVIGLGVVGVVAIGAASVLGLMAGSKNDDSKKECNPDDPNSCSDQGVALREDAFLFGNLATVGFIAGGAALVAAGVLWLTAGEPESDDGLVAIHGDAEGASLSFKGKF